MVTIDELDKFVNKFKCLFPSGSDFRLVVNAKARVAEISLHANVSLEEPVRNGPAQGHNFKRVQESPCKRRRRERREAERKAKSNAE